MMLANSFGPAIGDWSRPLPHPRFGIYRNNVMSALIAGLAVRYPVVAEIAGGPAFAALAGGFAARHRPRSPVLISYGGAFPDHVAASELAVALPFLGDVARLENLWWLAYHCREVAAVPASALALVPPDAWAGMRLRFHPSVALLASPHAVGSIWEARRATIAIAPEWVLVARPMADVLVRRISAGAHDLLASLLAGSPLADAVEDASLRHPQFEPAAHLTSLASLGIITELAP